MVLDLSLLPAPDLITIDAEADLAARIARLLVLFEAAGIAYDVEDTEHDIGVILQQIDAEREMLVKVAINDLYKQTLIGFARGAALDWFAASFVGLMRMDGETDARLRLRVLLAMDNKSGGRLSGYKGDCLNASVEVEAVGAWYDRTNALQPTVRLALMGSIDGGWSVVAANADATTMMSWSGETGSASTALVATVRNYVGQEHVKQATDIVAVSSVDLIETAIDVTLYHLDGPDSALLRANAAAAIIAMIAARRTPHRDLPAEAIIAAATVGGVERAVVNTPASGLVAGYGQLIHVTMITVRSVLTDG